MPPPNVTGELHIGHALFVAVEDIMIRWHRMLGDPTLWIPGADHAGIAGQWVVEKELAKEGLTRHDLGREKFLQRVWQFMNQYRGRIREQMMILGASCDWTRFVFTMDPGPSRAVRHVFKRLYDKGLIYRGERLISWCPRCQTALSDLEVVHRDEAGSLWTIAYPIEGSDEVITVATTRPRRCSATPGWPSILMTTATVTWWARSARLPILDRLIPIVADDAVDPAFGTGAVKGDARPRSERLRDRQAPRFAGDQRHEHRRHHERQRRAVRRDADCRRPFRRRRAPARRTAGCSRRAARPRGRPLPALRHGRRAADLDAVVRAHGGAGAAGHRRGQGRQSAVRPGAFPGRLPQLAGEHPRLDGLAAALVGSPHPGLVLPALRRDDRHRGGDARRLPALRRAGRAGSRRPRHLVLLRSLAVLDPGLAGRHPDCAATTRPR